MRPPSSPDGRERRPITAPRDPSYPDRARIDSDVREFLRQPSSPWIVFNREDGAPPEAPSPTAPVFPRNTLSGMPPAVLPLAPPEEVAIEPAPAPVRAPSTVDDDEPLLRSRRRSAAIAGCVAGAVGLVIVIAIVFVGRARTPDAPAADDVKVAAAPSATPGATHLPASSASITPVAPVASGRAVVPAEAASAPAKRFGKLTIRGDARSRSVYLDGKRLVGAGQRTFTVYCGEHMIAVGEKAVARKIDVPCSGEYFVPR